jgi:hypothetical protein
VVPTASLKLMSKELDIPTVVDKSANNRNVIVVVVQSSLLTIYTLNVKVTELTEDALLLDDI